MQPNALYGPDSGSQPFQRLGNDGKTGGMRAVAMRPTRPPGRVAKGTPAVAVIPVPAIRMAGAPCQMSMASAAQNLRKLNSIYPVFPYLHAPFSIGK